MSLTHLLGLKYLCIKCGLIYVPLKGTPCSKCAKQNNQTDLKEFELEVER